MPTESDALLVPLLGSPALAPVFGDQGRLQGMLDFEGALARAEAAAGVIPASAVPVIAANCHAALFDPAALAEATMLSGNPAIPLVKRLTALVAADDPEAARFVHWGATSQDAIDTGLILQLREALNRIEPELRRLAKAQADLAARYGQTPQAGRTWLQQALPVTFGLKAAGWLDATTRHRARLAEIKPRLLVLQFGGAAGTLASLGDRGLAVAEALACDLGLGLPALPWHSHRDRLAEFGAALGLIVGGLGKIARDLSLMMQTEVGEAFEPAAPGRGGSSTMPHKRNPVAAAAVLAAAARAPGLVSTLFSGLAQEHERGLGGWQAEWAAIPELVMLAEGAISKLADTLEGLDVDAARMRRNLDLTHGLLMAEAVMMALGAKFGRLAAHDRIEAACHKAVAEGRHLREVLAEDRAVIAELGQDGLARLFDPEAYLGATAAMIARVLAAHKP